MNFFSKPQSTSLMLIGCLVWLAAFSRSVSSQEPITIDLLRAKLSSSMKAAAKVSLIKTECSGSQNGEAIAYRAEFGFNGAYGWKIYQDGYRMAVGYNDQYGFVLRGSSDSGKSPWLVDRFAKAADQDRFNFILKMYSLSNTLAEYANLVDSQTLLELLNSKSLKIIAQKQLESGAVKIEFASTESARKSVQEYDRLRQQIQADIDSGKIQIPPEIGKRPTESVSAEFVIEPDHGHLVSRSKLVTRHVDQGIPAIMIYAGEAKNFKKENEVWYPADAQYSRSTSSFEENLSFKITKLEVGTKPTIERSRLAYYGLPDPMNTPSVEGAQTDPAGDSSQETDR